MPEHTLNTKDIRNIIDQRLAELSVELKDVANHAMEIEKQAIYSQAWDTKAEDYSPHLNAAKAAASKKHSADEIASTIAEFQTLGQSYANARVREMAPRRARNLGIQTAIPAERTYPAAGNDNGQER